MAAKKNGIKLEKRLTTLEVKQGDILSELKHIRTNHLDHIYKKLEEINDKFLTEAKWRTGLLTAVILTLIGTILNLIQ